MSLVFLNTLAYSCYCQPPINLSYLLLSGSLIAIVDFQISTTYFNSRFYVIMMRNCFTSMPVLPLPGYGSKSSLSRK